MKTYKVKNPCKICGQTVDKKSGLQCLGACKKWAHYNCLRYGKKKIEDIKAGIIKIDCPCPDCTAAKCIQTGQTASAGNRVDCNHSVTFAKSDYNSTYKTIPQYITRQMSKGSYRTSELPQSCQNNIKIEIRKKEIITPKCSKSLSFLNKATDSPCDFIRPYANKPTVIKTSSTHVIKPSSSYNGAMIVAMEQVCNTLCALSQQVQEMMDRMVNNKNRKISRDNRKA